MPEEICLLFTEFADLTKNPRSVLGSVGGGLANRGINIAVSKVGNASESPRISIISAMLS